MLETLAIRTQRTANSRIAERDAAPLEFGKVFSDHMLVVDYCDGEWQDAQIMPFGDMPVSPANSALHYGQAIFEGMKAYPSAGGGVVLFRPLDNWSLYIRPFMFATDGMLGVRPSDTYRFAIITCPVGLYYNKPLRVRFEQKYVRSAEGGAGFAKNAGNYGAAMYPTKLAQQEGYNQLIWTDSSEHQYVEESGTMNIVFVLDGKLATPALSTSILDGITRRSVLQLARDMGVPVEERRVSSREIIAALKTGTLNEAFGVGTAATIAPIATIGYGQMSPATVYANVLVTIETMAGLVFLALSTGLVFARISRPTARVVFGRVATVAPYDGTPTLSLRIGNERRSQILEADVTVTMLRYERTREGAQFRRFYDLALSRSHTPVFALTFTVMHPVLPGSPLHGATTDSLAAEEAELLISVTGLEETTSQTVHARHSYLPAEVLFGRRFADIFTTDPDGTRVIDYNRFHETGPA